MPIDANMVGKTTEAIEHRIDARWIMSYAAGLGDTNPRYLDTAAHKVVAHPLFASCVEWPAVIASRDLPGANTMTREEVARGVHVDHDLEILRPIEDGDRLRTRATLVGLRRIRPGTAQVFRLDTVDADGAPVARTYQVGILRGVDLDGEDTVLEEMPTTPTLGTPWPEPKRANIAVAAELAHVYSECARIWNPVHTDRAVALAAGLPDLILHGTATLALAVTRLIDGHLGGDPTRVRRLGGRFSAMVRMPCTLTLETHGDENQTLFFSIRNEEGDAAFRGGFLHYD